MLLLKTNSFTVEVLNSTRTVNNSSLTQTETVYAGH